MTLPPTASLAGAGLAVGEDADVESVEDRLHLGETGPLSQGVQAGGRHSEYPIHTVWRCVRRGTGGPSEPPEPPISFFLATGSDGGSVRIYNYFSHNKLENVII